MEAGLKPGPEFSKLLDYAHKLRLSGVDKDTALKQTLTQAGRKK
jgi:tRNA nucleotidyltransferase (CCA-adding enzyme)